MAALVQGDRVTEEVVEGMEGEGVQVSPWCPRHPGHACPNSVVLANASTGTRTIVHTNLGLPELTLQDLQAVPLHALAWVHLEGRNRTNLLAMLDYLANQDDVKVSVEVEKVGRGFEDFIPLADVVFVSKDVAMTHGCRDKVAAIAYFRPRLRAGASLVSPSPPWPGGGLGGGGRRRLEPPGPRHLPRLPPGPGRPRHPRRRGHLQCHGGARRHGPHPHPGHCLPGSWHRPGHQRQDRVPGEAMCQVSGVR